MTNNFLAAGTGGKHAAKGDTGEDNSRQPSAISHQLKDKSKKKGKREKKPEIRQDVADENKKKGKKTG